MNRIIVCFLFFFFSENLLSQESAPEQDDRALDSLLNVKVSTAAKYEQTISEVPASVTVITSEQIKRFGYRTLDEVMNGVRGFYTSYDRNYSYLGVRGFSRPTDYNNRILLLIDGHTTNENVYGSAFVGTDLVVNLESVDHIEIVRGAGSVLYGTGAMFAVINIITKKGNAIDGVRVSVQTGSYGRYVGSLLIGKEFQDGVDFSLSGLWGEIKGQDLYFQEYDDSSTNFGVAHDADRDKFYGVQSTFAYKHASFLGSFSYRKKQIPTGAFDVNFNDQRAHTVDERTYVEAKYDGDISPSSSLLLRGYFDHYSYTGDYPYAVLQSDASDGDWAGGEAQLRWDVLANNRLTLGTVYRNNFRADYRLWDEATSYFNDNFPFNVFSIYAQDDFQVLENLSFTFGVRRDVYSGSSSSTTPRIAVNYHASKSETIKLLYGEAFRAPNVYEKYYQDPTSNFKSNPGLLPEKIRATEVLWEQQLSAPLFGTIAFYHYSMQNLIDQYTDPTDSMDVFRNISEVHATGIGVELDGRFSGGLRSYANYAYQDTRNVTLDQKLSNSPSHLLKIGVSHPIIDQLTCSLELQYESNRLTVYGTTINSFMIANLNLRSSELFGHVHGSLLIRNLFNTSYKSPGGLEHKQPAIPQDGRNVTFTLECRY